jgi:hypothetical protein
MSRNVCYDVIRWIQTWIMTTVTQICEHPVFEVNPVEESARVRHCRFAHKTKRLSKAFREDGVLFTFLVVLSRAEMDLWGYV